ncbi:MAG: hypothetical protein ACK4FJ_06180 [Ferrovibrio sp.]|uniref:hypothetical protein n=1 Tax=Ferrovibrio sp. TaxID=1917215 RepID=UPI003919C6F8
MTRPPRPGAAPSRHKSQQPTIRSIRGIDDLRLSILKRAQRDFGVENQGELINAAVDALLAFLARERLLDPELNAVILAAEQRQALEHQWLAEAMRTDHESDEDTGSVNPEELAAYRAAVDDMRNTPPSDERLAFDRKMAERRARIDAIMGRTRS